MAKRKLRLWMFVGCVLAVAMAVGIDLTFKERQLIRLQYQDVYLQNLRNLRVSIDGFLNTQALELERMLHKTPLDAKLLEQSSLPADFASALFVLSPGQPPRIIRRSGGPASAGERNFAARLNVLQSELGSKTAFEIGSAGSSPGLWYPISSGKQWRLLYLLKRGDEIRGAALETSVLVDSLQHTLPPNTLSELPTRSYRVKLADEHQHTWLTWGNTVLSDEQFEPFVSLHLKAPLQMLRLEYLVPRGIWERSLYSPAVFTVVPSILLVLSVFSASVLYFYRSHATAIREAALRVNFVNQVSHELKTPLTNIRMYADLLAERLEDVDSEAESYTEIISSECARLSRLITNILSFSLNEKQKLTLKIRAVSLTEIVDDVCTQFEPRFRELGIKVVTHFHDSLEAEVDPDAVTQILANLFSNVEKYAAAGRYLSVRGRQFGSVVFLRVSDHGPGISSASKPRIFEPFYRGSDKLTDGIAGTGIGLSISRELARLHGGDLRLTPALRGAAFFCILRARANVSPVGYGKVERRDDESARV
ncbi:MAG: HAMP domain-containing sensor histidine kinase [Bdellovibrionota bacterium]